MRLLCKYLHNYSVIPGNVKFLTLEPVKGKFLVKSIRSDNEGDGIKQVFKSIFCQEIQMFRPFIKRHVLQGICEYGMHDMYDPAHHYYVNDDQDKSEGRTQKKVLDSFPFFLS